MHLRRQVFEQNASARSTWFGIDGVEVIEHQEVVEILNRSLKVVERAARIAWGAACCVICKENAPSALRRDGA